MPRKGLSVLRTDLFWTHPALSRLRNYCMHYVYVLKSRETRFLYIGVTGDLKKRVAAHNSERHSDAFTQKYKPWKLIYYEAYLSREDAYVREVALKKYGSSLGQLRKRVRRS